MVTVHGHTSSEYAPVVEALRSSLHAGDDLGASVAVIHDEEIVVDIWGGWSDEQRERAWAHDTIVNVWSSTKTVTALAVLMLVDRGELDVDAPIARYWPEFAAADKGDVTVRHALSHATGLPAWDAPFATENLYDWDDATERLATQRPWWAPGTFSAYHPFTQGFILGEVVKRVTGISLGEYITRALAQPCGADFALGATPDRRHRISPVIPPPPRPIDLSAFDQESILVRVHSSPAPDAVASRTAEWMDAELGAANGFTNARALAVVQSAVSHGGRVGGRRILSSRTVDAIYQQQFQGIDASVNAPRRYGVGFGLTEPRSTPYLPDGRICFWGGWGGSIVVNDADSRLTIAYTPNLMANAATPEQFGTKTGQAVVRTALDCGRRARRTRG